MFPIGKEKIKEELNHLSLHLENSTRSDHGCHLYILPCYFTHRKVLQLNRHSDCIHWQAHQKGAWLPLVTALHFYLGTQCWLGVIHPLWRRSVHTLGRLVKGLLVQPTHTLKHTLPVRTKCSKGLPWFFKLHLNRHTNYLPMCRCASEKRLLWDRQAEEWERPRLDRVILCSKLSAAVQRAFCRVTPTQILFVLCHETHKTYTQTHTNTVWQHCKRTYQTVCPSQSGAWPWWLTAGRHGGEGRSFSFLKY